jgi:F1F0 ATPase subunit 2
MDMNEMVSLALAWAAGILLGTMFFGGLWWTVQEGVTSKRPGLLFYTSLSVRTALTLVGFYWVSRGPWVGIPVCLLGFVIARLMVTRLTRKDEKPAGPVREVLHATDSR